MLKKLTFFISVLFITFSALGQSVGTIKGKMLDKTTGEPLPFANIVAMKGGIQVTGTQTDFDGKYTLTALPPGEYNVQATYVGYQPIKIEGVIVSAEKITFIDISASQGIALKGFDVIEYEVPLIDKGEVSSGGTVTRHHPYLYWWTHHSFYQYRKREKNQYHKDTPRRRCGKKYSRSGPFSFVN